MSEPQPPPRRWFRFSLRTMLLMVVVLGAAIGWTMHKVREQGMAVAALEQMGCGMEYDEVERPLTRLEWLRKLLGEAKFCNVIRVSAIGEQVTDGGLTHLRTFTELGWLDLNWTQVGDAGMMPLAGLN